MTSRRGFLVLACGALSGAAQAQLPPDIGAKRKAAAEEALRKAGERLEPAVADLENQVRRHPLAALGIAAAVGLVVGLLLSRK